MNREKFNIKRIFLGIVVVLLITVLDMSVEIYGVSISKEENSFIIKAKEIPSLEKLPLSAIHRIFQDSDGFMWYGTFDGLCRFDGYGVKVFRSDFNNPYLFKNNFITYIEEGQNGKIWIGTLEGLYVLDKKDYSISEFDLGEDSKKNVFTISVTDDNSIWVSVPGTLYRINKNDEIIASYSTKINGTDFSAYFVYDMPDGKVITSLDGAGMFEISTSEKELKPIYQHPDIKKIERIVQDDNNQCYWLGTWGNGIVRFDPKEDTLSEMYQIQPKAKDALGNAISNIFHIVQDDRDGNIWVTTEHDLFSFEIIDNKNIKEASLSEIIPGGNKRYYEIYKDRDGNLWISSFNTPSFIIEFNDDSILSDSLPEFYNQYKDIPLLYSMDFSNDGSLWFCQEGKGLFVVTKEGRLLHNPEYSGVFDLWRIPKISRSKEDATVWVSTPGTKVHKMCLEDNEIKWVCTVDLRSVENSVRDITSFIEGKSGTLWIGSNEGLYRIDGYLNKLERIKGVKGKVTSLALSSDDTLWIATERDGIFQLIQNSGIKKHSVQKKINKMAVSSNGILWLSTYEGEVYSYNSQQRFLKRETDRLALNGEHINDLLVDRLNHIWIVCHQFVREFNQQNGAFRTYNTYSPEISVSRFLENSSVIGQDGKVYVGGVRGLIAFPVSHVLESVPANVETHITDVTVNGVSRLGQGIIVENGESWLTLSPEDTNIEIFFSTLHYQYQDHIRFGYKMSGIDKGWVYTGQNKNSAFYNKLEPGENIFEIKATDSKGLWSDKISRLHIYRKPYFQETWYAKLILVILIIGIAYFIYTYIRKIRRHKELRVKFQELLDNRAKVIDTAVEIGKSVSDFPEELSIDQKLINSAVNAVEKNLGNFEFDVAALANELNMSKATLSRKLKNATGQSPAEFVREIRMQHAARLLKDPSISIAETADAVGYNDQRHFASLFKAKFGKTPSQYRGQFAKNKNETSDRDMQNDDI